MINFICAECYNKQVLKYKDLKGNAKKIEERKWSTTIRCIEGCRHKNTIWSGPNIIKSWTHHSTKWHPTTQALKILNKKLCEENCCSIVIDKDKKYCDLHYLDNDYYEKINDQNNDILIDNNNYNDTSSYIITDGNNNQFNINEVLKHYDVKDGIQSELQKDKIARYMVNAINKVSQSNRNLKKGIDGAIELRLLAPTFNHVP